MNLHDNGTEVEITIRGMVVNKSPLDTHKGTQRVMDANGFSHWVYLSDLTGAQVTVISPPHAEVKAGQVWQTENGAYFARISRHDLPLRMTPQDLDGEVALQTLEVNPFFLTYPEAVLAYDPVFPVLAYDPEYSVDGQQW